MYIYFLVVTLLDGQIFLDGQIIMNILPFFTIATCEELYYRPCTDVLPYTNGTFPNTFAITQPDALMRYRGLQSIRDCHTDFNLFLCTQFFPSCPYNTGPFEGACRGLCEVVRDVCGAFYLSATGLDWLVDCGTLPEESCIATRDTGVGSRIRREVAEFAYNSPPLKEDNSAPLNLHAEWLKPKSLIDIVKFSQRIIGIGSKYCEF